MKSKVLLLQAIALLLLLLHGRCQANVCNSGSETLHVGEVDYDFVSQNGVDKCVVSNCTDIPFPQVLSSTFVCNEVSNNCSIPATPHERNLSICCKHCSECDFLTCPEFSACEESSINGAGCQCLTGYEAMTSNGQLSCIDINECASNSHNCPVNSACVNVPGEFECSCYSGYSGPNCIDIDECAQDQDICPQSTSCVNHVGFYECVCTEECNLDINSYYLTTPNEPDDFFDHNPSCSLDPESFPGQSMVVCTGQQQLLMDHSTQANIPPDANQYVGWNRNQGPLNGFSIIINAQYTRLTRLDIHFYNNPSVGIGLPEVSSIHVSSKANETDIGSLSFVYAGNEDLAQSDNGVRTISIIISDEVDTIPFYQFVRINFVYSSSRIWRTQLTEIQGYGGTGATLVEDKITYIPESNQVVRLGVDNVVSEVDLSCTVANPGRFLWEWTRASDGAVLTSGVSLADLTRTSVLTISNLSLEASGDYVCTAVHSDTSLALKGNSTITLDLAYEISKNGPMEPVQGSDVTLSCEFLGYYPKEGDIVEWDFEGRTINQDGSKYSVNVTSGSSGQSQSGGTTPGPSLFTSLTFSTLGEEDLGIYGCRVIGSYSCSQLIGYIEVSTGPDPCPSVEPLPCTTAETLSCPSEASQESIINNVIWFYLFVMETIAIVIMILFIIVVIIYCKHHSGTGAYTTPFPKLTRPNNDEEDGIDLPDGKDDKMYKCMNGVDWAGVPISKV